MLAILVRIQYVYLILKITIIVLDLNGNDMSNLIRTCY
nr:MAG TPA: hypothetical protein [Caudoviricetes sp.]